MCVCDFILDRATTTSTDDVDLLAIDLFATMVQQYEEFITPDATRIIAEKFKSTNSDEVLLALNVNIYINDFVRIVNNLIAFFCFSFVNFLFA